MSKIKIIYLMVNHLVFLSGFDMECFDFFSWKATSTKMNKDGKLNIPSHPKKLKYFHAVLCLRCTKFLGTCCTMAHRPQRSPMPIATLGMLRISMLGNFEDGRNLRKHWHRLGKPMISLSSTMTRKAIKGGKVVNIYVAVSTSLI